MLLKPESQHLNLLVRVPLKAIRDVVFPERGPEQGPGYLDLERTLPLLPDASILWISDFIQLYEGEIRLPKKPRVVAAQVSLESDPSFASYEQAAAHIAGPKLSNDTNVAWNQTTLDVWFEYPIHSDRSRVSIHPELARLGLRVVTALRFLPAAGRAAQVVRAFEFIGDPGLVRLDPRWHQAALRFVDLGFFHILDGTDHLLFLFCLVIPFRRFRALIPVVTAISIVYMALENIAGGASVRRRVRRRWMIAFGFGLVHGFGFSFALRQTLQFAGSHLLTSLLSFNIGVELGQLLVLLLLIPVLEILFRFVVAERMGTIILSALVAHTAWHWMTERADRLSLYRVEWPELTLALMASAMRWSMLLAMIAGLAWFLGSLLRRGRYPRPSGSLLGNTQGRGFPTFRD